MPSERRNTSRSPHRPGSVAEPRALSLSKLEPPRQRIELLERHVLSDAVSSWLDSRLIMVCAPAGYGKSTFLTQLYRLQQSEGGAVAWLGIDANDNDPVRFARHLLVALNEAGKGRLFRDDQSAVDVPAFLGLESGPSDDRLRGIVESTLDNLEGDATLFIDDLHFATSAAVHRILVGLLTAPAGRRLHLVVATRERPNWPLARLRAVGQLHELGVAELSFSLDESTRVLRRSYDGELSGEQIRRLHEHAEGWPAGLQLVSLALAEASNVSAFIDRFSGADRAVAEFLVEEVLQQLAPELQRFMFATSLLRRFDTALANAVLGIENARDLIDQIESRNLFLLSLDRQRQWYRYHALLSDLLRRRISDSDPSFAREVHRRAGDWLSSNGQVAEAIEHALAIPDLEAAGQWLDESCQALFASGQTATLQHYADRLPAEILVRLPRLQLELVWEDIIQWRFERARRALNAIADGLAEGAALNPRGELRSENHDIAARLAHREIMFDAFTDDLDKVVDDAKEWQRQGHLADTFMHGSIAVADMMARREQFDCEFVHGQSAELRRRFLDVRAVYGTVFLDSVAGASLFMRGELTEATHMLERGVQTARDIQGPESVLASMPSAMLAMVHYEADRVEDARQCLDDAGEPMQEFGVVDALIARQVTAVRLALHDGDRNRAHRILDASTYAADRFSLDRLHAHVLAERVRLLVEENLARDAQRIMLEERYRGLRAGLAPGHGYDTTRERMAAAAIRLDIEAGELTAAHRRARQWVSWLSQRPVHRVALRMSLLLARAQARMGDRTSAHRTLVDALKRSAQGGLIRSIVDEGPEITSIVAEFAPLVGESGLIPREYLSRLLVASGLAVPAFGASTEPALEQQEGGNNFELSVREVEVLKLAAANFRTEETARAMGVSESTVKWYWQRIFEHMGVRRRMLAVRLARERGLLDGR